VLRLADLGNVLIDPGPLPHPLAASTDISKAVRRAYGADEDYTALADRSIELWRKWNEEYSVELYHEVGVMFVRRQEMKPGEFEHESFKILERCGHKIERMNSARFWKRFPAWNPELYRDGVLELEAGYAESGRVVATLIGRAKSLGIELREGSDFATWASDDRVSGIVLDDGQESPPKYVVWQWGGTPYSRLSQKFRANGRNSVSPETSTPSASSRPFSFSVRHYDDRYYGFPLNRDGG
jgi:glycine/D-amino acid oxidase-like deaminating enzyme